MITWIFPMAGYGTRVRDFGPCKPLINISGKFIFSWCFSALSEHVSAGDKFIIITTVDIEDKFGLSSIINKEISRQYVNIDVNFIFSETVPNGPAESVYLARKYYRSSAEVVIVNHDQFTQFQFPDKKEVWDVFVPLYVNSTGCSSYVSIEQGFITDIREKELISNYASAGVYGFSSGKVLIDCLYHALNGDSQCGDEYFIGPAISNVISNGFKVLPTSVIVKYDLGTSDNIRKFIEFTKIFTINDTI